MGVGWLSALEMRPTSLTVTMRSDVTRAPLRMFTAGPSMDAQVGYSQDSGSYLWMHRLAFRVMSIVMVHQQSSPHDASSHALTR